MNMKRILVTIAVLSACVLSIRAQDVNTVAMGFSVVPRNPVALSMGGVSALVDNAAWSAFDNVAAVPFFDTDFSAAASWQNWWPSSAVSSNHLNAGASYLVADKIGVALGATMNRGSKYDVVDAAGRVTGDYTPNDIEAALGVSYKALDFLSVGVGVKYMKSSLASDYSLSALAFDAMLNVKFSGFEAAAGIQSIGGKVDDWDIPANVIAAVSYGKTLAEKHGLSAAAQMNYYLVGGMNVGIGAAYCYDGFLSVRAGYNLSSDGLLPSFASAGLGVNLKGLRVDAAYVLTGPIAGSISVAIGCSF